TLYRLAKTNNPLFYFGSAGVISGIAGTVVAAYVLVEWLTVRVSHEILAVVAAFAVIIGVQLVIFGVLSDMILAINREQTRRFEALLGQDSADRSTRIERGREPADTETGVVSREPSDDRRPPAERARTV